MFFLSTKAFTRYTTLIDYENTFTFSIKLNLKHNYCCIATSDMTACEASWTLSVEFVQVYVVLMSVAACELRVVMGH